MKFGTRVDLYETMNQNSQKLELIAMETGKTGNDDFEALFDHEGLRLCYQIHLELKYNAATNYCVYQEGPTVCVVKIFHNLIKYYSINSHCRLKISSEYRY